MAGCTPYLEATSPSTGLTVTPPTPVVESGSAVVGGSSTAALVHRVRRGETLWRIARNYGVDVQALAKANGISDVSQIAAGQRLMIPGRTSSARASPEIRGREAFVWPVKGRVISTFGMRRGGALNKGIDIQSSAGADVVAARSGEVSFIHEGLSGFGKTIILEHEEGFATVYAYVGEILVRVGERVRQRQVIARVGQTGRAQTPTLHFEVRRGQKAGNPLYYLP